MKHETAAYSTRCALAAALKRIMAQKPVEHVTVSEVAAACGVNRKTFYYHFHDVYELLKWMLEQEAIDVVRRFDLMSEYEEAIEFVMDYVDANRAMISSMLSSFGRGMLKKFFYDDFNGIMERLVDEAAERLNVNPPREYRGFLCVFYTEAIAGMLMEWCEDAIGCGRAQVVEYLSHIFRASLPAVLRSAGPVSKKVPPAE